MTLQYCEGLAKKIKLQSRQLELTGAEFSPESQRELTEGNQLQQKLYQRLQIKGRKLH